MSSKWDSYGTFPNTQNNKMTFIVITQPENETQQSACVNYLIDLYSIKINVFLNHEIEDGAVLFRGDK